MFVHFVTEVARVKRYLSREGTANVVKHSPTKFSHKFDRDKIFQADKITTNCAASLSLADLTSGEMK